MSIFSYHLVRLSFTSAFRIIFFPHLKKINGLVHHETMSAMILGSSIFSSSRIFNREIVFFAQWENEDYLNEFLKSNSIGKQIAKGWHIRLEYLRQWGKISGFQIPTLEKKLESEKPVVAVTLFWGIKWNW